MKVGKSHSPDDLRERYLGEIAPLLAAARDVESLSPAQKKQVRKRVLRTVLGSRSTLFFRFRLSPVMVAVVLLVAGGVAFATAERLGLIHRADQGPPSLKGHDGDWYKRRGPHLGRGTGAAAQDSTAPAVGMVLPEMPDPLLTAPVSPGDLFTATLAGRATGHKGDELGLQAAAEPTVSTPGATVARSTRVARTWTSRATPITPNIPPAVVDRPVQPARKVAMATPYLAEPVPTLLTPSSPSGGRPWAPLSAPAAVYPAPAPLPSSMGTSPAAQPQSAPAAPTPSVAPVPAATRPVPSDPILFGQALRKLRNENDPAAALVSLQQHAQAYPRSAFSGERSALEVEALLALHRDREALQKLDGMSLEKLPRSGERLVVRGELRAAARRWNDAKEDFDRALSRVSGSPSWHERALWGRGVARLRCGERGEGMEDIERYHDLYPKGRFAGEASRFFPNR